VESSRAATVSHTNRYVRSSLIAITYMPELKHGSLDQIEISALHNIHSSKALPQLTCLLKVLTRDGLDKMSSTRMHYALRKA
jgi:hypothetical protein